MRIVLIITDYGSFNNFLGDLSIRLLEKGNKVDVFTSKEKVINIADKYNYINLGINFHFINFPRSFNLWSHYKVSKEIQRKLFIIDPDIVSIHFTTAIFSTLLAGRLPFKTIGAFHGLGYPVIKNLIKKKVFKFVEIFSSCKLDEIWLLNNLDYSLLKPKFKEKVFLLPTKGLGCNIDTFDIDNYSLEVINDLKVNLGIQQNDFVIAFTGRFVHFKGFNTVVRAFRKLEVINPAQKLKLITMGGFDKIHPTGLSKEEENYFKNAVNIINIGFTKDVADYLAISDLFVFPSQKEGIPVCIIEALAMGLPVIASDARGCNDLVINNKTGFLLDKDATSKEYSDKIRIMIENKSILKKFKKNIEKERLSLDRNNFISHQLKFFSEN